MAVWQSRLVREKRRFFDLYWLPWQHPLKNQKKLNGVIKPFQLSTNPEILVKIGPLVSEPAWLQGRPLKKNTSNKKNIGKIYIPSGNFAERAKSVTYVITHDLVCCMFIYGSKWLNFHAKSAKKLELRYSNCISLVNDPVACVLSNTERWLKNIEGGLVFKVRLSCRI